MNHPLPESERLTTREIEPSDSAFVFELVNSDGFIKYIGDRNVRSETLADEYILHRFTSVYSNAGYGLYAVVLKTSQKPIGICGFVNRDYLDSTDFGFAFLPDYTGKGYAYEIAQPMIVYGFSVLQFDKILAIVLPDNLASIKLLKKCHFIYDKDIQEKNSGVILQLWRRHSPTMPQ